MTIKLVKESIDSLFHLSDETNLPMKITVFTVEEKMEIMELILRMKEKGKYLKKSVEMMAYRMGRTPRSIRQNINKLIKNDPETKLAIFPPPNGTKTGEIYYKMKKLNKRY